jgi:hypothetical protein
LHSSCGSEANIVDDLLVRHQWHRLHKWHEFNALLAAHGGQLAFANLKALDVRDERRDKVGCLDQIQAEESTAIFDAQKVQLWGFALPLGHNLAYFYG